MSASLKDKEIVEPSMPALLQWLISMDVLRKAPTQERSIARVESILVAASKICVEKGLDGLSTAAVAERVGVPIGTVYQFFENRDAIIRGIAVRINFFFETVIKSELDGFDLEDKWFRAHSRSIDRAIDIILENEELRSIVRVIYHHPQYQEVNLKAAIGIAEVLVQNFEKIGIKRTPQREDVAYFSLRVASFCQHLIILEEDAERREFLRRQFKLLSVNYLPPAMVGS